MVGAAVDGANRLVSHDDRPDVALRFVDVLLDVKNAVLVGAERLLVLEHRLGRVTVIDLCQQSPPGTNHWFEHDRVSHRLDGLQGGLPGKGDDRLRYGKAGAGERGRGQDLVAADPGNLR